MVYGSHLRIFLRHRRVGRSAARGTVAPGNTTEGRGNTSADSASSREASFTSSTPGNTTGGRGNTTAEETLQLTLGNTTGGRGNTTAEETPKRTRTKAQDAARNAG